MILPSSVTVHPDSTQIFGQRYSFNFIFYSLPPIHKGFPNIFWRWGEGGDPPFPPYCAVLSYTHSQPLGKYCKGKYQNLMVDFWDHIPKFFMTVWHVSKRCLLPNKNKSGRVRLGQNKSSQVMSSQSRSGRRELARSKQEGQEENSDLQLSSLLRSSSS